MKTVSLFALMLVAACGGPTAPQYKDPFAMVHFVNQTSATVDVYFIITGADADHSGVGFAERVRPGGLNACHFSASVPFEREFVYVAVEPSSALSNWFYAMSSATPAAHSFADSLGLRQVNFSATLNKPGLVAFSALTDLAPLGYAPTDTVPWKWTVSAPGVSTLGVDATDHTCVG